MVEYHRASPKKAERHTKMALRGCLREKAGGKVPDYLIKFLAGPLIQGYRFAAKNGISSIDDPKVVAFKEDLTKDVLKDAVKLGRRLHKEKPDVRERSLDLLKALRWDQRSVPTCVAKTVEKIRKREGPKAASS